MMMRTLMIALVLVAVGTTSCDKCRGLLGRNKVDCSNGGTCNGGQCDCLKGYSGITCDSIDFCEFYDVVCVQGLCDGGYCQCEEGYEGDSCSIETRAKFIGSFRVTERCNFQDTVLVKSNNIITIERDDVFQDRMDVFNVWQHDNFDLPNGVFFGIYSSIEATAKAGAGTFTIPSQKPDDNQNSLKGSGQVDTTDGVIHISIEYIYTTPSGQDTCWIKGDLIPPTE